MNLPPFKLERYFADYEFKVKYLLSPSDCEPLTLNEVLALADSESLALWEELRLSYTESQGHPVLREEIAGLYEKAPPDRLLIAAPEELIYIAMQVLLRPGDRVMGVFPAYQSLYEIARSIGCQVQPWSFRVEAGSWQLPLDELEASARKGLRLIVINFPHNPTGYLPSRQDLERIVEVAESCSAYLFSDEMYRLLELDPARRLPPVCDLYEKAISLSGLSKSFALPGLRLGWLASQNQEVIGRCMAFKDYTTICNSAPSEILGLAALRARETILARNLDIITKNLGECQRFFSSYREYFQWLSPQAGSIAFPRWVGPGSVEDFCQQVLERQGVMIVPGSIFDYPAHFRVGLGRRNLPQVLEPLEAYLQSNGEVGQGALKTRSGSLDSDQ